MKKIIIGLLVLSILVLSVGLVTAKQQCTTIQDGGLVDSKGNPISVGYDQFGYNYQAHMFNGRYCDYDRVIGGPYCDVNLIMKWSDDWLANKDCNGDGKLDRGGLSGISQGWLTNHQWGSYEGDNGETCNWDYFVKIVYPCLKFNNEGQCIWGSYSVIQEIYNDPCAGESGVAYKAPAPVGFGYYK